MPGYQAPHRERWPEPSATALEGHARGRGYTIASAIDPSRSKIEANLEAKGFTFYMPVEYSTVRNRTKPLLYELRRFALLKGYVFVELADTDWLRLYDVVGVKGVVENAGRPFAISMMDMFHLRMYEARSKGAAEKEAAAKSRGAEKHEREKRKAIVKGARKKLHAGREVKLIWGDKVGREATVQAWEDQDKVKVILKSLDAAEETITVPFEFLKVAS
jgi:transcription antitermination factor NusG